MNLPEELKEGFEIYPLITIENKNIILEYLHSCGMTWRDGRNLIDYQIDIEGHPLNYVKNLEGLTYGSLSPSSNFDLQKFSAQEFINKFIDIKKETMNSETKVPTIKITSFKQSGKYYTDQKSEIKKEHLNLYSWDLLDLIMENDESVRSYSGLLNGFVSSCYYVIETFNWFQDNEHKIEKFTTRLIDNTK